MRRPWSARARRRLLRAGIVLAVVLGVTAVVLLMPQPHREAETFHNTPADVPTPSPQQVKASPELQKLLVGETAAFVRTAVLRRTAFPRPSSTTSTRPVQAALDKVHGQRGLSVAWVLIPIGGILAVFMLPIVLFLVERRRSRRAEAAHQAALAARQTSSSSPS